MQLGKVIRKHRERAKLTQEQLATNAQMARTHLIAIEGNRIMSLTTLLRLSSALRVPAWQILKEADDD